MFYKKDVFYCVIEILKQVNETNDLELEEKVEKSFNNIERKFEKKNVSSI